MNCKVLKKIKEKLQEALSKKDEHGRSELYSSEYYKEIRQLASQIELFGRSVYQEIYYKETFLRIANPDFGNNIAPRLRGFLKGADLKTSSFENARRLMADVLEDNRRRFGKP